MGHPLMAVERPSSPWKDYNYKSSPGSNWAGSCERGFTSEAPGGGSESKWGVPPQASQGRAGKPLFSIKNGTVLYPDTVVYASSPVAGDPGIPTWWEMA